MGKPSKWFLEVFLPSAIDKMQSNKKYPNTMILSDKQADVCYRNMEHKESHTDYGWIGYNEITVDGYVVTMSRRGRYTFLNVHRIPTQEQQQNAKAIMNDINSLEDQLDVLYENKEENADAISELEAQIDSMWDKYNEALKV